MSSTKQVASLPSGGALRFLSSPAFTAVFMVVALLAFLATNKNHDPLFNPAQPHPHVIASLN